MRVTVDKAGSHYLVVGVDHQSVVAVGHVLDLTARPHGSHGLATDGEAGIFQQTQVIRHLASACQELRGVLDQDVGLQLGIIGTQLTAPLDERVCCPVGHSDRRNRVAAITGSQATALALTRAVTDIRENRRFGILRAEGSFR